MHRIAFFLFAVLALSCSSNKSRSVQTTTPNVVLIFADDLAYADLSSYGATAYATPELDKLAMEGARFTNFYVSQPVCSASRASLLTGSYANRIGIHGALGPSNTHGIHTDETTLAEVFKSKGYSTAIFGKWHLGHLPEFLPTEHGFDEFYGIPYSNDMWPYHPENPEAWPDLPTMEGTSIVGYNTDQSRFTTDFTNRAVKFIEKSASQKSPFFLYLAHPMPHVPLFVSDERKGNSGAGLFGDVIQEIDWSVGQVVDAIERFGITRDTIITLAREMGISIKEGLIPREALYVADEVFFTGTAAEVTPIRSIDHHKIGSGRRGELTERLQTAYFDIVHNGNDPHGWLTHVPVSAEAV